MLAYVDASVWIACMEGTSNYQSIIVDQMEALQKNGWEFAISFAVMMEALHKPYRNQDGKLLEMYHKLFSQTVILCNYTKLFEDGLILMQLENVKGYGCYPCCIGKASQLRRIRLYGFTL